MGIRVYKNRCWKNEKNSVVTVRNDLRTSGHHGNWRELKYDDTNIHVDVNDARGSSLGSPPSLDNGLGGLGISAVVFFVLLCNRNFIRSLRFYMVLRVPSLLLTTQSFVRFLPSNFCKSSNSTRVNKNKKQFFEFSY